MGDVNPWREVLECCTTEGVDFRPKLIDVVGVMQLLCFIPFIPLAQCLCIGAGEQEFLAYLRAESPDYLAACY